MKQRRVAISGANFLQILMGKSVGVLNEFLYLSDISLLDN